GGGEPVGLGQADVQAGACGGEALPGDRDRVAGGLEIGAAIQVHPRARARRRGVGGGRPRGAGCRGGGRPGGGGGRRLRGRGGRCGGGRRLRSRELDGGLGVLAAIRRAVG